MEEKSDALERAIAAVADGRNVDWEALLASAGSIEERSRIEDLCALSRLNGDMSATFRSDPRATIGIGVSGTDVVRQRWLQLEVLEEIGRGAHGVVYRAWDTRLAREVALKLTIHDEAADSIAEARRLARVSHPNVVSIHGAERVDGQVGLWMELLRGRTLEQILRDQGPFSVRETIGVTLEICSAVASLHALGIIHRDIKAQNVVREPGGRLVVMDVGASLELSPDDLGVKALTGTPLYMAPELFEGAHAGVLTDVYAIGVLMYRLVTADFPIHAQTIGDVRRAHAGLQLRPLRNARPDLPQAFIAVVERCLAANPALRFGGVAPLEQALREFEPGGSVSRKGVGWGVLLSSVVLASLVTAIVARMLTTGPSGESAGPQRAPLFAISPDQYNLFAGYEELAFNRRTEDPRAAEAASRSALNLIRETLPGNHPIFALLYSRQADSSRRQRDFEQANRNLLDAKTHTYLSVGENHPYGSVVAMEMARTAIASGDVVKAASEILKALEIRSRVLGLSELGVRRPPFDAADLERALKSASLDEDSDADGLADVLELAAGLNPRSAFSSGDGVFDDDRNHDPDGVANRLSFGGTASPFLTWAHYGATSPRSLLWQSYGQFPMIEAPNSGYNSPSAWSITARRSQGYPAQRLSPAHSARALERGFSLFIRAQPREGAMSAAVDTAPLGPRFDIAIRRLDDHQIEVWLLSSVIPREGRTFVVQASSTARWPLFELRYRPQLKAAALYVDGRRCLDSYVGHHQFQDSAAGGVSWSVVSINGAEDGPSAAV